MADVRKFLTLGVVCLFAMLYGTSPASAKSPTGSLLKISDLPAGWVSERSSVTGFTPPCLASAEASLARFPEVKIADVGETGHLAQLAERVVSVPRSILTARYSEVLRRFRACNGSTWTRGAKFRLSIERRAEPRLGNTQVTGFSVTIGSPSTNVEPNPYPGLVDLATVGNNVSHSLDAVRGRSC